MGVMGVRAVPWDPYFTLPRIGCQAEEPRVLLSGNVEIVIGKGLRPKAAFDLYGTAVYRFLLCDSTLGESHLPLNVEACVGTSISRDEA